MKSTDWTKIIKVLLIIALVVLVMVLRPITFGALTVITALLCYIFAPIIALIVIIIILTKKK